MWKVGGEKNLFVTWLIDASDFPLPPDGAWLFLLRVPQVPDTDHMKKDCRSLVEVEVREEHPLLRMDFNPQGEIKISVWIWLVVSKYHTF